MIKRTVTVLVFGVLFLGLLVPQDSLETLKPNLNAAQAKPVAKPAFKSKTQSKNKATPIYMIHAKAKADAMRKIREAQRILDNAYGPGAVRINRALTQLNQQIDRIRQARD